MTINFNKSKVWYLAFFFMLLIMPGIITITQSEKKDTISTRVKTKSSTEYISNEKETELKKNADKKAKENKKAGDRYIGDSFFCKHQSMVNI